MANALFFPNPLDHGTYEELPISTGQSFSTWLEHSEVGPLMSQQPVLVTMNGEPLLEADWNHELSDGDHVALFATPQGLSFLSIVLWTAVAVTLAYTLYTVLTLPSLDDGVETSPNNTLSVRSNQARLGQAIPVAYGNSRIYPDLSSNAYSYYDARNDQIVYMLYELSQGSFNVDVATMRFESTLLSDFPGATYEVVPPGATSTLFPKDVNVVDAVSNVELAQGLSSEYTTNDPGTDVTRIDFDIIAPRGLYKAKSSGKKGRVGVQFQLQTREIDDAGTPVGSWITQGGTRELSGATSVAIKRTFSVTVAAARYEARINRITAFDPDSKLVTQLLWGSLRAFFVDDLPATTTTRIAVRIRATDGIGTRALTKFSLEAQRLIPTWSTGGGWTGDVATNSPAWAAADVLRNSIYGANRSDAYINLDDLEALATACAAAGYECNGVIDTSGTVWDALQRIGHTCNAVPIDDGGVYTMVQDVAKTVPVQMFNMRNITKGSFKMLGAAVLEETKDYVVVKFRDKDQDYRESTKDCVLPGGTSNNPLEVTWWGIDNGTQAWELGMLLAAKNLWQRERVQFETLLGGRIPLFGDLISVSHYVVGLQNSPQISGDVIAYDDVDLITVSEEIPSLSTPYIRIHKKSGEPVGPYQCTVIGTNQVRIDEAFTDTGLIFSNSHPNPRFQMGSGSVFDVPVRVVSIEPTDNENVRIQGVVDVPEIYTVTDGETEPPTQTVVNLQSYLPVIDNFRAELGGAPGDIEVHLSWESQNSTRYNLEYSIDAGVTWIDIGEEILQTRYIDTPDTVPGVLWYRVAGQSVFDGPWVTVTIDTSGAFDFSNVPPDATELYANALSEGVEITGIAATDDLFGDPEVMELWRVESPDTLITDPSAVLIGEVPVIYDLVNDQFFIQKIDGTVTGGLGYSYFVRPENRLGLSANYYPTATDGVLVTPIASADGRPGIPGASVITNYDDADTAGAGNGAGRYAFLTDIGVNTSGTVTWEDLKTTVVGLIVNSLETGGLTDNDAYYAQLGVGQIVTWLDSDRRWIEFQITSVEAQPSAGRRKFGVTYIEHDEFDGAQDIPTAAGNPVEFRWAKAADGDQGDPGVDGDDGLSFAEILLYKTVAGTGSSNKPPTPTGGSHNFGTATTTPPAGWSATFPEYDPAIEVVYATSGTATAAAGGVDSSITWSTPIIVNSGTAANTIYKRSASQPATPSDTPADNPIPGTWFDDPNDATGSNPLWSSNGRIKHNISASTMKWVWDPAIQVEGQDGDPGDPGAPGDPGDPGDDGLSIYEASVYKRSASAPSTPSGGQYNFTTKALTAPSGWAKSPPAGNDPLYISTGGFSIVGQTGTDTTVTWSTPAVFVQHGDDPTTVNAGVHITYVSLDGGSTFNLANTQNRTARFFRGGVQRATTVCHFVLTPAAGTIAITELGPSGEDTTFVPSGSGTANASALVTHDDSGVDVIYSASVEITDLNVRGEAVPQSISWSNWDSDSWAPSDNTLSIAVKFFQGATQVASVSVDATLTTSGGSKGDIAVVKGTSSGDACTLSLSGNNTSGVTATVTHDDTGVAQKCTFYAVNGSVGGAGK